MKTAIAVSACCFKRPVHGTGLCEPTIQRLEKTLKLSGTMEDSLVVVLGKIPRKTYNLGCLMEAWLLVNGCKKQILIDNRGLETMSACRGAMRIARQQGAARIIWVTSDWHLKYGEPVWRYYARRSGLAIDFADVEDAAGKQTREDYKKRADFSQLIFGSNLQHFGAPEVLSMIAYARCFSRRWWLTYDGCR